MLGHDALPLVRDLRSGVGVHRVGAHEFRELGTAERLEPVAEVPTDGSNFQGAVEMHALSGRDPTPPSKLQTLKAKVCS